MKLLFVITGIGLGHTIREAAIIQEILKQKPDTKIAIAGFKNSYRYFHSQFPTTRLKGHQFPENSFTINRFKLLLMNLPYPFWLFHDKKALKSLIREFKPDKIISDLQPVGIEVAHELNIPSIAIYNVELSSLEKFYAKLSLLNKLQSRIIFHYVRKTYEMADHIIIPRIAHQKSRGKFHMVPPIIRTLPTQMPAEKTLMKKLKLSQPPVLIMLGGSTFGFKIAEKLKGIARNTQEQFIIFGYKNFKESNVTSFTFKENFLEYLKVAKACILLSGHTALAECMVYKKPTLVFPFKNYIEHYLNVHELDNLILTKYIDDSISEKDLQAYIQELLLNSKSLEKKLERLKFPVNGARDAARIILNR